MIDVFDSACVLVIPARISGSLGREEPSRGSSRSIDNWRNPTAAEYVLIDCSFSPSSARYAAKYVSNCSDTGNEDNTANFVQNSLNLREAELYVL